MAIYYGLILMIVLLGNFIPIAIRDKQKQKKILLSIFFLLIFLLCVLRSPEVGRDIPGYKQVYDATRNIDFADFNYIYFEKGYVLLMKVCTIIGLSFQSFLIICYLIILLPVFYFIYKYSSSPIISTLIFICYMFLETSLSALRQSMALSVIVLGVILLLEKKKRGIFWFYIFNIIAILFHTGAVVCLTIPFLRLIKKPKVFVGVSLTVFATLLLFRVQILSFIKDYFEKGTLNINSSAYFGLNAIFLTVAFIFILFLFSKQKKFSTKQENELLGFNNLFMCMMYLSILIAVFFGNETTARSYIFYNIALIPLLPNAMQNMRIRDRQMVSFLFALFFIFFFTYNTVIGNNLDIIPYKFFWQN